jgi:hypothetical protein
MGGAAGEAYRNVLAASGMPPAGVLAREAIQNSVDAKAEGEDKVTVRFISKALTGAEKQDFIEAAGLKQLSPRYTELQFKEPNSLQSLSDTTAPIPLMFIEDWQTTGLEGDPHSANSKFYRLLLSLGDGGKEHDEHGTGGSFGYGKGVYSASSRIQTIFAYTRTKVGNDDETTRLFGCGYYRKHDFATNHFTGRSWFGTEEETVPTNGVQIIDPLVDDEADEIANKLGFAIRGMGDLGTTILIVDVSVELPDVLAGVEDWWWPRLIEHKLDVELIDADGKVSHPRPRKREHLKPFLEAYDIAVGRAPPQSKTEQFKRFNKLGNTPIGTVGLKVLEQADDGSFAVDEKRLNSVALIRSPLMVVAYSQVSQTQVPAVVGAYVAPVEIDDILRSAEPPAHHLWDVEAPRLEEPTGVQRATVDRVLRSVRSALKQFQSSATPPPPPKPKRLGLLERTLASFFTASKGGSRPGPDTGSAPISLSYDTEPTVLSVEGMLCLSAAFSVRPKADYEGEPLRLKVRASCPILEDGQVGDRLPMVVHSSLGLQTPSDQWHEIELNAGDVVRFHCETEPYDSAWTVRFVPEVQPAEGGE